jgi:hypothetical protein
MYIQNVIGYWFWDSCWFEFITKEYKCGSHGYCAYNQVIGFRVKYSFHPNAWYPHWQSNLSKGLVSYPFYEAIMASDKKPLVSICTHVVNLQLDDVAHSGCHLPYIKRVPWTPYSMILELFRWKWSLQLYYWRYRSFYKCSWFAK